MIRAIDIAITQWLRDRCGEWSLALAMGLDRLEREQERRRRA